MSLILSIMLSNKIWAYLMVVSMAIVSACRGKIDIPAEFPTPPPPEPTTPAPKLALRPDIELEEQIRAIASEARGKVGVAAVLLETGDAAMLASDEQFPMQSVYKLPIAMAVIEQVRVGKLDLDETIGVTKEDMVREGQRSPLRDANPNGGEFTIRELIRLALVESDGTASDVLMRVAGGPEEVQSYLLWFGIRDINVRNTEKEIGNDWGTQYQNGATPADAVELLRYLCAGFSSADLGNTNETEVDLPCRVENYLDQAASPVGAALRNDSGSAFLLKLMSDSTPGAKRLKGHLPKGTVVAHKTGTSGTENGITAATNDIGIIYLPNGQHVAIAVFVSDSPADEKTREAVIAKIAKAAFDKWSKAAESVQQIDFNTRHTLY